MASNSMLPVLLAAGAAFFLMGRKGDEASSTGEGEGEGEGTGDGGQQAAVGFIVPLNVVNEIRTDVQAKKIQGTLPPEQVPAGQQGQYLLEDAIETAARFFEDFPTNRAQAAAEVPDSAYLRTVWGTVLGIYQQEFPNITIPPLYVTFKAS